MVRRGATKVGRIELTELGLKLLAFPDDEGGVVSDAGCDLGVG